ncbi:MAG: DUF1566 domain-containing protein [Leptospiraceae bacterium]
MKTRLLTFILLLPCMNCLFAGLSGGDSDSEGEMLMAIGYLQLSSPPPPGPLTAGNEGTLQISSLDGPLQIQWDPATGGQSSVHEYRVYVDNSGPMDDPATIQSSSQADSQWFSFSGSYTAAELEPNRTYYLNVLVRDGSEVAAYESVTFTTGNPYATGTGLVLYDDGSQILAYSACSAGQTFDEATQSCTGTASSLQFCDVSTNDCNGGSSSGTLVDSGSWTSGASSSAWQACEDLNTATHQGISTWRIPTIQQLRDIRYCSSNPAYSGPDGCPAGSGHPTIRLDLFPDTPESQYWSSQGVSGNSFSAWTLNLTDGSAQAQDKTGLHRVRCISDFPGY